MNMQKAEERRNFLQAKEKHSDGDSQGSLLGSEGAEIYECSCGKQYKSFPAIYLHFRTKHDIKLSTKEDQSRKNIVEGLKSKKYLYSVEIGQTQKRNLSLDGFQIQHKNQSEGYKDINFSVFSQGGFDREIQVCVRQFLVQNKEQDQEIYKSLLKFFKGPAPERQVDENEALTLQTLPNYFNAFVLDFIPQQMPRVKIGSSKWKALCNSLQKFAGWLRNQKKTSLLLICQF